MNRPLSKILHLLFTLSLAACGGSSASEYLDDVERRTVMCEKLAYEGAESFTLADRNEYETLQRERDDSLRRFMKSGSQMTDSELRRLNDLIRREEAAFAILYRRLQMQQRLGR